MMNKELIMEKIKADYNMSKCRWLGVDVPREEKIMYVVLLPPASLCDSEFVGTWLEAEVHNLFDDAEYEVFEDYFFNQSRMEQTELWEEFEACGGSYIRYIEDYKPESEDE